MNLSKLLIWVMVSMIALSANAQFEPSEINYERKVSWIKIYAKLPWITEEEKTRQMLVWGKDEGRGQNYSLKVNPSISIYQEGENESEYSWSWKQDEFLLIQNIAENKMIQQRVVGGKLIVVEDKNPKLKWKIHNEIRQVAGYLCMKAVTQDTIKDQEITAWFTTEIPISAGPEGLYGLPGLILMVDINDGTMILEATEIKPITEPIAKPKKIKGKKMSTQDYNELLEKYFKQCIEGKRNPYWGLRY